MPAASATVGCYMVNKMYSGTLLLSSELPSPVPMYAELLKSQVLSFSPLLCVFNAPFPTPNLPSEPKTLHRPHLQAQLYGAGKRCPLSVTAVMQRHEPRFSLCSQPPVARPILNKWAQRWAAKAFTGHFIAPHSTKCSHPLSAQANESCKGGGPGTHVLYVYICLCTGLHELNPEAGSELHANRLQVRWGTAPTPPQRDSWERGDLLRQNKLQILGSESHSR